MSTNHIWPLADAEPYYLRDMLAARYLQCDKLIPRKPCLGRRTCPCPPYKQRGSVAETSTFRARLESL